MFMVENVTCHLSLVTRHYKHFALTRRGLLFESRRQDRKGGEIITCKAKIIMLLPCNTESALILIIYICHLLKIEQKTS